MPVNKDIKILVVDDATAIRMIAVKIIKKLGFPNVEVAENGLIAFNRLKKEPFDLVIADWQMPEMSGMDLLKAMKEDDKLKDLPFLLVTADEDQDNIVDAIKAGISNLMKKPYNAEVLLAKITRVFEFQKEREQRPKKTPSPID